MQPSQTGFHPCGDARIYYEIYGQYHTPPLLLLHGNGESLHIFDAQIPVLSRFYTVVAIDSRGHGQSTRGSAPLSLAQIAEDTASLLAALQLAPAHLLGFSDGGNIALLLALAHPGLLRSLILCGANLDPAGVKAHVQIPITLAYQFCKTIGKFDPKAASKAAILGLMVNEPHIDPARLGAIELPTLVVAGQHDIIRPQHTRLIARSIPGAALSTVPRADHFIPQKHPAQLSQLVLDFLPK